MSVFADLRAEPEFARLVQASARLGAEPLQVQAAGGNTSLKRGDAMWIKASGTWLAEAETRDIWAPVDLAGLRAGMDADAPGVESAIDFVAGDDNPSGLRPSIETTVHAAFADAVTLHTHCVATIAVAIRADGEAVVAERLAGFGAIWVPYVKPGLRLSREIMARAAPGTRAVVLGNHGLVAVGPTVGDAEATLRDVSRLLAGFVAADAPPAAGLAAALDGTDYAPAPSHAIHALALDPRRLDLVRRGPWTPDEAIFLGPKIAVAEEGETVDAAAARVAETVGKPPPLAMLPGLGAAIRRDASPAARALAQGLADWLARVEPDAEATPLTPEQTAELMDWDAEKYRQSLDAART